MTSFKKSDDSSNEFWGTKHKFEHWYRDNSIYFITARCRDKYPAFASEEAKEVFWNRFDLAIASAGFQPWVTSLMDNHYHTVGYMENGLNLKHMMKTLHGGVAKLVNDILCRAGSERLLPFWVDARRQNYMDGCLRNVKQGHATYRYVLTQAERHGIVSDWREYAHTRVCMTLEDAIAFAIDRKAFMEGVPYKRYEGIVRRTEVRLPCSR